jgi:hypothetical protein
MPEELKPIAPEYYTPNERLTDYMVRLLQFKASEAKHLSGENVRTDVQLAEDDRELYDEKNALGALKTRIMKEVVFPSMASLVFFFEMIESNDLVEAEFDSYLYDLLGIATDPTVPYQNYGGVVTRPVAFARLVKAILKPRHPAEEILDYRIVLIEILQGLIWEKLSNAMPTQMREELVNLMSNDFARVMMWTRLCAKESEEDFKTPAKRTIFRPLDLKS